MKNLYCCILTGLLYLLSGCQNNNQEQKAEPVPIVLESHENTPKLEMLITLMPTADPLITAQETAAVVQEARKACAELAVGLGTKPLLFRATLSLKDGVTEVTLDDSGANPFASCVVDALNGKKMAKLKDANRTALLQIRAVHVVSGDSK